LFNFALRHIFSNLNLELKRCVPTYTAILGQFEGHGGAGLAGLRRWGFGGWGSQGAVLAGGAHVLPRPAPQQAPLSDGRGVPSGPRGNDFFPFFILNLTVLR